MKNFAMIGVAGYIAPRHLQAIKDTGNNLVAGLDKSDSVGVLDSYFPDAAFFTEFERFDRHLELLKGENSNIDYVSIASPNYLHDSHIRFGLRLGADAICEKPLVINPWNAERLKLVEETTGGRVYTILQLRLHPSIIALRNRVHDAVAQDPQAHFDVDLTYLTSRGAWYFASWKGEEQKSGGIAANIGIHFFDMLIWVFGAYQESQVNFQGRDTASGVIRFANATVRWFLSVNPRYLPVAVREKGQRTYRSILFDGEEVEFSEGFTNLHTTSYEHILRGDGFGIDEALPSIELVYAIRTATPAGYVAGAHPLTAQLADASA